MLYEVITGPDDAPDAPLVVVVNETFANQYFPDEDPIGQSIAYDQKAAQNSDQHYWYEIVGDINNPERDRADYTRLIDRITSYNVCYTKLLRSSRQKLAVLDLYQKLEYRGMKSGLNNKYIVF